MDSRFGTGKYCTKPKSRRWSVSFFSYIMDTTRFNVQTLVTLRNWVNNYHVLGGFNLVTHIEGSIPYINLYYIILHHASYSVYVLGNVSYKLLRDTLPHYTNLTEIRDISIFIYYLRFLGDSRCGLHHTSPQYCLLAQGCKKLLHRKLLIFMKRHFF